MQEGLANIAVLTGERTVLRQRVEVGIPRKRVGGSGHDKVSLGEHQCRTELSIRKPNGFQL